MKILFVGARAWDDSASVRTILNEIAGNGPVHLVVAYETRGSEAYAAEWARQRAKTRRTFVDVVKAGKTFGESIPERRPRRDAYMVNLGGYDVVVILNRKTRNTSDRTIEVARRAEQLGIPVKTFDYQETVGVDPA